MIVNILLFNDFETLDVFGPVEVLGRVAGYKLTSDLWSGGVVKSRQGTMILTGNLNDMDKNGILLVPGGQGTRPLVQETEFIADLREAAAASCWCLTVCTGAALLAGTGLLDGLQATSNKKAFSWVVSVNEAVNWQPKARWCVAGKYYTASGVSAGIDMALGFVADRFGNSVAESIAENIEYIWHDKKQEDQFAVKA